MKILLMLYTLIVSFVGSITGVYFVGVLTKLPESAIVAIALIVGVITLGIVAFASLENSGEELLSFLVAITQAIAIAYLVKTPNCRRIRSDIKLFLSDKNPKDTCCPYDTHGTLLGGAIDKIWEQEYSKRLDEILVLTDINS